MTDFTFETELFSDLHKDAYGFRPRGHRFYDENCSDEEKQQIWDDTVDAVHEAIDEDHRRQEAAVASFEQQIAANIDLGAGDRTNAIGWGIAANTGIEDGDDIYPRLDDPQAAGALCYEHDLPYSMEKVFQPILEQIWQQANINPYKDLGED